MNPNIPSYYLDVTPYKPSKWSKFKRGLGKIKPSWNSDFGRFQLSKKFLLILVVATAALIGVLGYIVVFSKNGDQINAASAPSPSDSRQSIAAAKETKPINRDFNFPLKDDKGEVLSQVKYTIDTVELRDEIVVKGQKATAIQGKTFLIINLKLTNNFTKEIKVNTRDYVRLLSDGQTDQLAADIHNDPVLIQPDSTKITRIGYTVDDTVKKYKLLVGELNGDKTTIDLEL
jgi:hypothetical protein